jgi:hypothetical protein
MAIVRPDRSRIATFGRPVNHSFIVEVPAELNEWFSENRELLGFMDLTDFLIWSLDRERRRWHFMREHYRPGEFPWPL